MMTVSVGLSPAGLELSFQYTGLTMRTPLKAASPDTLFSAGAVSSQFVAVRDAKGKVTALRGTMLGVTQEYTRATAKSRK
jgi:hypothetical protein